MILTLILVFVALAALAFLVRSATKRASAISSAHDLAAQIRPVDVDAFRNLIDPSEQEYLRTHLAAAQFRRVNGLRMRAAIEYVACVAQNAKVLARMGEAATRNPDPAVAEAGARLVDSAARLRIFALQARARLYVAILLPGMGLTPAGLPESYERMTGMLLLLGRLQRPPERISAAL